jgi:outer membrane protein W
LLFPVIDTIESNYNPIVQADFILGPGFRYNINEKLKLRFGIGLNVNYFALLDRIDDDKKFANWRIGLGIGGDIGLKYDLTDAFYLDFGIALDYNFADYRWIESTIDNWTNTKREASGWINNYSVFGIRPYIGIGINLYQEKIHIGKPKE